MEAFIRTSPAASIAAQLMGTEVVRLYHDHVLVKEPGTRQRTPWHQDLPYYNVDGRLNASMWFPVDPVTRAATLEFVAGSHLGPWYMPRSFLDGQARGSPMVRWRSCRTSTPTRSDSESSDGSWNRATPCSSTCSPCTPRAAWTGQDDGAPCRCGSWATTWCTHPGRGPPHRRSPASERELARAAPLDHPLFPVLWPGRRPPP